MNKALLTALGSFWIVVFAALSIYFFSTPRSLVLRVLSQKQVQDIAAVGVVMPKFSLSYALPAASSTSTTTATSSDTTDASSAVQSSNATTTYEYKILTDVDPCIMNKLGAQGWHILNLGSNLSLAGGHDDACKKGGSLLPNMDWVLFERISQY